MAKQLYDKDADAAALGQFYLAHIMAMTVEGLHEKSDIAVELARRDKRISDLSEHLLQLHALMFVMFKPDATPEPSCEDPETCGMFCRCGEVSGHVFAHGHSGTPWFCEPCASRKKL